MQAIPTLDVRWICREKGSETGGRIWGVLRCGGDDLPTTSFLLTAGDAGRGRDDPCYAFAISGLVTCCGSGPDAFLKEEVKGEVATTEERRVAQVTCSCGVYRIPLMSVRGSVTSARIKLGEWAHGEAFVLSWLDKSGLDPLRAQIAWTRVLDLLYEPIWDSKVPSFRDELYNEEMARVARTPL